jgi:hypothetical protein
VHFTFGSTSTSVEIDRSLQWFYVMRVVLSVVFYSHLLTFTGSIMFSSCFSFSHRTKHLKLAEYGLGGGNLHIQLVTIRYTRQQIPQTYLNILRRSLILSIANSAILLNNHSPTTVPVAHTSSPAMVLGERRVAHEKSLAVLGAAVDLAPSVHDERVVGCDDDDLVDTLGRELLLVLEVGRDVHGLAAGGESAGDGDEDDLLAGELFAGVVGLRKAAGGRAGVGDGGPAVGR